ncbi:MAG: hypothetical protein NUV54_02930 [Candidatus Taylorbacteria bacterium]|nr:hypothetical protein [Candidatus Taylorbacteria bacterium]
MTPLTDGGLWVKNVKEKKMAKRISIEDIENEELKRYMKNHPQSVEIQELDPAWGCRECGETHVIDLRILTPIPDETCPGLCVQQYYCHGREFVCNCGDRCLF